MTKQWSINDRPAKQGGRIFAHDGVALDKFFDPNMRVKTALMLPATEARCIKYALDKKIFSLRKTQLICVEGDPSSFKPMMEMVNSLGFRKKPIFIQDTLSNVILSDFTIDYAFLDIYGMLTEQYAEWIKAHLIPALAPNANLAFTFFKASRGCRWLREQRVTQEDLKAFRYHMLPSGRGDMSKTIACLLRLFGTRKVTPTFHEYRDQNSTPMFILCLDHITGSPDPTSPTRKRRMSKPTQAEYKRRAAKAVETRKANALFKRRSEAAKKAVETRKANALFKKRSEAAKKAVATRRRNAA